MRCGGETGGIENARDTVRQVDLFVPGLEVLTYHRG